MTPTPQRTDVLVVGAGPSGASAAAWAARAGRDVVLADAAVFPRDKTCGDGLTPRAIAELDLLGLGDWVRDHTVNQGLRAHGFGQTLLLPWPGGTLPDHGSAVPRTELDDRIRSEAIDAGATALEACVDGLGALDAGGPRRERLGADAVVELGARHRRPVVGQGATGPGKVQGLPETVGPQALVDRVLAHPLPQPEVVELSDRARGQPVAAGLVAGEHRGVGEHDVTAGAGRPRRRGGAGGSRAHDEDVGALGGRGHPRILATGWHAAEIGPSSSVLD